MHSELERSFVRSLSHHDKALRSVPLLLIVPNRRGEVVDNRVIFKTITACLD